MPIHTFMQPGAFDPDAIAAMTEAFDAACEKLGDIDQPEVAREVIAGRIIAAAKFGERDPARLLVASTRPRLGDGAAPDAGSGAIAVNTNSHITKS